MLSSRDIRHSWLVGFLALGALFATGVVASLAPAAEGVASKKVFQIHPSFSWAVVNISTHPTRYGVSSLFVRQVPPGSEFKLEGLNQKWHFQRNTRTSGHMVFATPWHDRKITITITRKATSTAAWLGYRIVLDQTSTSPIIRQVDRRCVLLSGKVGGWPCSTTGPGPVPNTPTSTATTTTPPTTTAAPSPPTTTTAAPPPTSTAATPPPTTTTTPTADKQAPSVPTGFAQIDNSQTAVRLSWNASSDNVGVAGYDLYLNGGLTTTNATSSYVIGGLSCSSSYTFGVDAYDAAGNHSAQATTTGSTQPCPQPTVSVSKGAHTTVNGCTSSACAYIVVTFSNFAAGNHSVTCYADDPPAGPFYTYSTSNTTSAVCVYGYSGRHVWATVDGVSSGQLTW